MFHIIAVGRIEIMAVCLAISCRANHHCDWFHFQTQFWCSWIDDQHCTSMSQQSKSDEGSDIVRRMVRLERKFQQTMDDQLFIIEQQRDRIDHQQQQLDDQRILIEELTWQLSAFGESMQKCNESVSLLLQNRASTNGTHKRSEKTSKRSVAKGTNRNYASGEWNWAPSFRLTTGRVSVRYLLRWSQYICWRVENEIESHQDKPFYVVCHFDDERARSVLTFRSISYIVLSWCVCLCFVNTLKHFYWNR